MERHGFANSDSRLSPAQIFEGQKDGGLLDVATLTQIQLWLKSLNQNPNNSSFEIDLALLGRVGVVAIQAFGMVDDRRPDQANVATTQAYLDQTVANLRRSSKPKILLIMGPAGDQEGYPGGEGISTANYLARQLNSERLSSQLSNFFIIPCGTLPLAPKGLNDVNNLKVAKQILEQINDNLNQQLTLNDQKLTVLKFEALWTESSRLFKQVAICLILGLDLTKIKTANRVEIKDDGTVKNLYQECAKQTFIAMPIILFILIKQRLKQFKGQSGN